MVVTCNEQTHSWLSAAFFLLQDLERLCRQLLASVSPMALSSGRDFMTSRSRVTPLARDSGPVEWNIRRFWSCFLCHLCTYSLATSPCIISCLFIISLISFRCPVIIYYYYWIYIREDICSCSLIFVLSPAHAEKNIASWDDISDRKARESQWGKAVLDSVPEQTTISNFAENR